MNSVKPKRCLVCGHVLRSWNRSYLCHVHLAAKLRKEWKSKEYQRKYMQSYMKKYRKKIVALHNN